MMRVALGASNVNAVGAGSSVRIVHGASVVTSLGGLRAAVAVVVRMSGALLMLVYVGCVSSVDGLEIMASANVRGSSRCVRSTHRLGCM